MIMRATFTVLILIQRGSDPKIFKLYFDDDDKDKYMVKNGIVIVFQTFTGGEQVEMSALYAAEGPEMDEVRMFLKKERLSIILR